MADKETKKPVMDIEKPGTTPASATSRPIIISKGPAIKDPMVNQEAPEDKESKESQAPLTSRKKTIQPLSEQPKEENETVASETESKEVSTPALVEDTPTEEIGPNLDTEEEADKPTEPTEMPEVSEEERKRQELVGKLIDEKKYFVPIGAATKKRTARNTTLLFLIFLLVVGGVVLAIDAELIHTDITLPFDLIKN